jgi:hypothetical protein
MSSPTIQTMLGTIGCVGGGCDAEKEKGEEAFMWKITARRWRVCRHFNIHTLPAIPKMPYQSVVLF